MLSSRTTNTISTILRPSYLQYPPALIPASWRRQSPICATCATHASQSFSTSARRAYDFTLQLQRAWRWSIGLLRNSGRRPKLELARQSTTELVRGMKVRSSVKKLCEGCKVGFLYDGGSIRGANWDTECPEERLRLYYMLEKSEA